MKPLDRWARDFGYSDFDTFTRAGGSARDVAVDIRRRLLALQNALNALARLGPEEAETPLAPDPGDTLDHSEGDEPADPDNAQIQGAELG